MSSRVDIHFTSQFGSRSSISANRDRRHSEIQGFGGLRVWIRGSSRRRDPLGMTLPTVLKHLRILEKAGGS
jgi:hypothetical protein